MHPGALKYFIKCIDRDFDSKDTTEQQAKDLLDDIRSWGVPELTVHANLRQQDLDTQLENEKVKQENNYE